MASRYNLLDYDSDQDAHEVPDSNLLSAAFFIADLFQRHGIPYGVMGGFALRLMGPPRETHDVDIAFQAPGKMRDATKTPPRDLDSRRKRVLVNISDSEQREIYTLDMLALVRGKMTAFMARGKASDRMDVRFLLQTFPDEVQEVRDRLDPEAVDHFLESSVFDGNREYWKRILGR
ncbi:hypothetical protein VTN00DRAFT_8696 [Thermoascus crustaceus]|uniref:uncharacterized protein n=1 Tax=Thermoascus crustaceus TaxID=5088 RepID=UPI003743D011